MLNPSFDALKLSDEHVELRAVLRDLCEREIAPHAADVDEQSWYPEEALKALDTAGFSSIHIPEQYGGQGGDAVAACIVMEEVARVCASSSMIPISNKLGTMGLILRGSDDLKHRVIPTPRSPRSRRHQPNSAGGHGPRSIALSRGELWWPPVFGQLVETS